MTNSEPNIPQPVDSTSDSDVILVGIDDDTAMVFGMPPADWDLLPMPLFSDDDRSRLTEAVAGSLGAVNVAAQGMQALSAAQGLVRLSPETLAALKSATPMTSGGWNLGALTQHGTIVSQVKWLPAGAAGGVAVLAALGPALTLLAMQHQMAQIKRAVEESISVTTQVLRVVQEAQWAELEGLNRAVTNALDEAQHIGEVSPHVWAGIAGREPDLNALRILFTRKVEHHLEELRERTDAKARHAWLRRNVESLMSDTQAMVLAEQGWYTYQFLRAGSVVASTSRQTDAELARKITERAQREHRAALDSAGGLLDHLVRLFGMMAEMPGRDRFQLGGRRRTATEVSQAARATAQWVDRLRGTRAPADPPVPAAPEITTIPDIDELTTVLQRLRWSLDSGEEIRAVATVRAARPRCDYAIITSSRMLLARESDLLDDAELLETFPVDEIRYVRIDPDRTSRAGQKLRVTTKHRDLELTVQASDPAQRPEVDRFAQLLASLMVLPAAEIPGSPITVAAAATELESGTNASTAIIELV